MTERDESHDLILFAHVLAKFQFIEEGIRIYLRTVYALIRHRMRGEIPIKLSGKTLQRKSLSALLLEFERFNMNGPLIENIRKLIPKRNHVAHVAFYEMYEALVDSRDNAAHLKETRTIGNEAHKCIELLHQEIENVECLCRTEGIPPADIV
jgi:hypothetical protein